jgi:Tol biopolymer transport system component/predicted Ser/Thr protein kinase
MTPERWKQIEQLYHSSLKQEPGQRATFLQAACDGDEGLRREVESLLAFEQRADGFIESPPQEALEDAARGLASALTAPPLTGEIGHYQILSRLGEGGMGVVYKARDKSLGRSVAIKVLSAGLVADPEHRKRLVLEARMASALNHPNIVTVHEVSNQDGMDFIVMEYVAGRTLAELIPRQGLPLKEALAYAIQIADGLAVAHAAGIIHRDLKPSNVMVTESGLAKILDFGLAKLTTSAGSQGSGFPTALTSGNGPKTGVGTLLGTVSYMSPEQAEGKPLDARSDIFSFGLMLYEMVTGQRAFAGDSNLAILTAILREEPTPVREIVTDVPRDLEQIVNRCLRKDPKRRWHMMVELKIFLQEVKEDLERGTHAKRSAPIAGPRRRLIWSISVLVLAVAGSIAVWLNRSVNKVAEVPLTVVPLTSYPGEERQPAFSPDGNQVAFSWNGEKQDNFDIYIKDVESGAQRRLTTAPEADSFPSWSPDGRTIAFVRERPSGSKGSVYLISPLGPPERKVADLGLLHSHTGLLPWTPDGKSLVISDLNSENESEGLFLLSVETGEKRRLTFGKGRFLGDIGPSLSPNGRALAFVRELDWYLRDIYLLTLSEDFQPIGEPKRLTFENRLIWSPVWTLDGQEIIFSSSSGISSSPSLFRIAASGSGKPQRLAAVGENASEPAISQHMQRLAYTSTVFDVNIWRVEVPGPYEKTSPPMKLISSTRADMEGQFSPDGKKIAFNSTRTGNDEIWVCNSDGSGAQQLTSLLGKGNCGDPRWSPDGERITFSSNMDGRWANYVINSNGGKPKRFTPSSPVNEGVTSSSRDGKSIYFASERSGESQVWKAPADGGEAQQVTRKGGVQAFESADGNWLYYTKWSEGWSGLCSLWRMPKDGGEETQVLESVEERTFEVVKEGIYFVPRPDSAGRSSIQFFNFATKRIRSIATIEKPLWFYLSVSPDGRWILYSQTDQETSDLMLVENFR